jgi:hypothetical protein
VVWWALILPTHDRDWRPDVAVMPRAFIDGDRVRITGVRNFDYRARRLHRATANARSRCRT